MRRLMVVPAASLVLASGCAGDSGERAEDAPATDAQAEAVARNLAAAVKEVDGGTLTDVSCVSRPSEVENSTRWECRCMRREGISSFPAVYSAQARSDGQINNFVLKEPR